MDIQLLLDGLDWWYEKIKAPKYMTGQVIMKDLPYGDMDSDDVHPSQYENITFRKQQLTPPSVITHTQQVYEKIFPNIVKSKT